MPVRNWPQTARRPTVPTTSSTASWRRPGTRAPPAPASANPSRSATDQKVQVTGLRIANGYQKSDATFAGNVRVRRLRVSFSDSPPVEVALKDAKGYQDIVFNHPYAITSLRLTILATYPTFTWDDAALSEVQLVGYPK